MADKFDRKHNARAAQWSWNREISWERKDRKRVCAAAVLSVLQMEDPATCSCSISAVELSGLWALSPKRQDLYLIFIHLCPLLCSLIYWYSGTVLVSLVWLLAGYERHFNVSDLKGTIADIYTLHCNLLMKGRWMWGPSLGGALHWYIKLCSVDRNLFIKRWSLQQVIWGI